MQIHLAVLKTAKIGSRCGKKACSLISRDFIILPGNYPAASIKCQNICNLLYPA